LAKSSEIYLTKTDINLLGCLFICLPSFFLSDRASTVPDCLYVSVRVFSTSRFTGFFVFSLFRSYLYVTDSLLVSKPISLFVCLFSVSDLFYIGFRKMLLRLSAFCNLCVSPILCWPLCLSLCPPVSFRFIIFSISELPVSQLYK
jgi:hypothetical protein